MKATYESVKQAIASFRNQHTNLSQLFKTLNRSDFRLSQNFWQTLMRQLNDLKKAFDNINSAYQQLDGGLQQALAEEFNYTKDCLGIIESCLTHEHIKNNWARLRVWITGTFNAEGSFNGSVLSYSSLTGGGNVGHATLETSMGYISLWPDKKKPRYFSTLYEDLRDEGPDAEAEIEDHEKRERQPDYTIDLFGLDVHKINDFCKSYVAANIHYFMKPKLKTAANKFRPTDDKPIFDNCITACTKALQAGGVEGIYKEIDLLGVKTPNSFAVYLNNVKKAEAANYPLSSYLQAQEVIHEHKLFKFIEMELTVTEDYEPEFNGQLHLTKNEKVWLAEDVNDGFWYCRKGEQKGLVPKTHVRPTIALAVDAALQSQASGSNHPTTLVMKQ